jgi:carbamoylphosphate synthase small subunit
MDITDFVLECRHCANKAPMEVLVQKSFVETHEDDQHPMVPQWDVGFTYQVLRCYSCRDVTVYQLAVHTGLDPEYIDRSYDRVLYPCGPESPGALPSSIQAAWDAAMRVRKIDPNAFSVLLGRVLDVTCIQENSKGDTLYKRIERLAAERGFPEHLTKAAHGLAS